ncbi:effector binding domain-containing protein [Enterococcus sp. BWM-S5]|uniref:Effector binding domain-containing protein n=1 Tax=Enterococcus larvae TaxID=2794352 RepID=A0ABS4CNY7_9ENTE|nr:effector binding domain-containing protein [Enterococcus larvae]MBP1048302.1 effector binding domain-containing protein [Enterococcus larvae]
MTNQVKTISEVAKNYEVTPRMLRYYEKLGLIQSTRLSGYAYRVYDIENTDRIQKILFLRKLRLSLKEIGMILNSSDAQQAIEIFEQHIYSIDQEVSAYTVLRKAYEQLITVFKSAALPELNMKDEVLQSLITDLPIPNTTLKEEINMTNVNQAAAQLKKIEPRVIHVPAYSVAAAHFIGPDPEQHAFDQIKDFVQQNKLWELMSDIRVFGFNHPNPSEKKPTYGYEFWVTIPEDMEIPAPLKKKQFNGGEYAAHSITMGNFQEWGLLEQWVSESPRYEYRGNGNPENMFDSLEEHLNAYTYFENGDSEFPQMDLMIPVRRKRETP